MKSCSNSKRFNQELTKRLTAGVDEHIRYRANFNDLSFKRFNKKLSMEHVYDAGARQIGIKQPGFFSLSLNPEVYIKNTQTNKWEYMSDELSVDGKNKHPRLRFEFTSTPWFSSPDKGVGIATIGRGKEQRIMHTIDGGKNWTNTKYKLPKQYCVDIVSMVLDTLLLSCAGMNGDFYESTDNGKTWVHVREHVQF